MADCDRSVDIDEGVELDSRIDEHDIALSIEQEEEFAILRNAIDGLHGRRREVVRLFYLDERDTVTVAEILKTTPYQVMKLRGEALSLLRSQLMDKLRPNLPRS